MFRAATGKRFDPEAMFHPRSVLLVGAESATGRLIAANLRGFKGEVTVAEPDGLPGTPHDLAVLACAPEHVAATVGALGRTGTFAVVCAGAAPGVAAAADAAGVRVLGPNAFGVIVPGLGLNASSAHLMPGSGKVALVSQSAALCRAVIDWAGPNGVGFSYVVGTGGNVQTGFTVVLDFLSRDPGTGAILLDIRTIRDRRAFLAAARAAARLRPVVAIRAGGRLVDSSGRNDGVFDAALRRAGVLRVGTLAELFGAAEVLTRSRPARSEDLAIVTNAVGPAHMAADASVQLGLGLVPFDLAARAVLSLRLPTGPSDPGIVWCGADGPERVAEAAAMLGGLREVGGIVAILAPTGPGDAVAMDALIAARGALRVPLMVCVLGETTGARHRRRLADAGIPVFATPESAVRAFGQLVQQRRARAAAAELPARRVLEVEPDAAAVRLVLERVRTAGRRGLLQDESLAVLAAYGVPVVPSLAAADADAAATAAAVLGFPVAVKGRRDVLPGPDDKAAALDLRDAAAVRDAAGRVGPGPHGLLVQRQAGRARELRISVVDDPLFGPAIGFGLGGTAAALLGDVSYELPPLNLALAQSLIGRTRAAGVLADPREQAPADREAVADTLVRISQLLLDHPEIAAIEVNPLFASAAGVVAVDAWIGLREAGERALFAVLPYPAELVTAFEAKGVSLVIRPIRPEDASAHQAFFARLRPEDVRYRFFSAMRELPAEQVARMTQVDYGREIAFVAAQGTDTVGVARLVREPATETGEFAVIVQDSMKGKGVARRLMQALIDWAAGQGMSAIIGQVLAENAPMLAFMRRMGATIRRLPDEPDVVEAVIAVR